MEYEQIFEQVRSIVAEVLQLKPYNINLDFPLFQPELYDKRKIWASTGDYGVITFRDEDSEYYEWVVLTAYNYNFDAAQNICDEFITQFDIEFLDEIFLEFTTVKKAVDYIYEKFRD